ncbi:MAG: FHA domain-containing protein [Faecousia sp.]
MNRLIENGHVLEMACGTNFSYILSDNNAFLSTEYKVLQSQVNSNFVKCMKMLYNGQVQLFYLTTNLKPFSSMIPSLDADSFMIITSNLISDIIDVKQNGFLSCQNINISFDKIFVDPTTYKVSLVYVPISKRGYDDYSTFENEIRTGLVKLISGVSTISSPKTIQLASDLSNGMLTMEDLSGLIKGGKSTAVKSETRDDKKTTGQVLRIVAMNAPTRVEIEVTKDRFVLGKNASSVDGVISFNKMISRVHCRIDRRGDKFTITDLQSANGTYVNRVRLQPNQPQLIKNGDVIRLANSDFQVKC